MIIGGGAAVLHGAPLATSDLEIVYNRSEANVDRLLKALEHLEATYRFPAEKILPGKDKLMHRGHHLLITKAGALDVLAFAGDDHEYPVLSAKSVKISDAEMRARHRFGNLDSAQIRN